MGFLLLGYSAQAIQKFQSYPVRKASECVVKDGHMGLSVGVEPMESLQDQESYFNTVLSPKGFLPIYIVIENNSDGASYIFDKNAVTYGVSTGKGGGPTLNAGAAKTAEVTTAAAIVVAPIAVVASFIAAQFVSNATEVQQNLLKSEVQSTTLSVGDTVHGFLYIPVPKKRPRGEIHLQVPVTKAGTKESFVLNLVF